MAEGDQFAGVVAGISSLAQESLETALLGERLSGVSCGTITDEMFREYIDEQEDEQLADDSRFPIDNP